jgi:hypothetical protein
MQILKRHELIGAQMPGGPDFLVIGAQRSGTSWLYQVLRKHPELWLPPLKELHYFDKIAKPQSWQGQEKLRRLRGRLGNSLRICLWDLKYFLGKRNDEWYAGLFTKAQQKGLLAGEVTPAYALLNSEQFLHVYRNNTRIKLIFIMRDPVERAWSAVNRAFRRGHIPGTTLTIQAALKRARRHSADSEYIETVNRLDSIFPSSQLHYCFFEDLALRPVNFVSAILSFLGVSSENAEFLLPTVSLTRVLPQTNPMPVEFEREIAGDLLPSMQELCERFNGPPHKWRNHYEKLLGTCG